MAQKARMAVMLLKPLRLAEGTERGAVGLMKRGHRGPLYAGWGTRLDKSEKERPRRLPSRRARPAREVFGLPAQLGSCLPPGCRGLSQA